MFLWLMLLRFFFFFYSFNRTPLEVNKTRFSSKEHTRTQNLVTVDLPQTLQLILLTQSTHPIGPKYCHLLCAYLCVCVCVCL